MKVYDFLDEFAVALKYQLKEDDKRWGDTWKQRHRVKQEFRIEEHIQSYFDRFRNANIPVPWLKIAGLAMIGWIRENHPEMFPE